MSVRQCGLAAAEDDWPDEQLELVDQPATRACAARVGPPTRRSLLTAPFRSCPALGSRWRSRRVFAVDGAARLEE
jgi:hypothetical protein